MAGEALNRSLVTVGRGQGTGRGGGGGGQRGWPKVELLLNRNSPRPSESPFLLEELIREGWSETVETGSQGGPRASAEPGYMARNEAVGAEPEASKAPEAGGRKCLLCRRLGCGQRH